MHTTLSAAKFQLLLEPGKYRIHAEHGKEFLPADTEITVGSEASEFQLALKHFANMPQLGWYSGDTHVHRTMADLPNLIMAEDLNVALPLNYWVRDSKEIPSASGPAMEAKPINVDATHVIYPINTEYEIFSVEGKRHTQGAVFVLNHRTPLNLPTPPALPVAEEVRRQGAILSVHPLRCIEIIRNGETVLNLTPEPEHTTAGAWKYAIEVSETLPGSGWLAVRCFEKLPDAKVSFAHTNPVFVDVPDVPLVPRRRDAEFFVQRMDEEIARNTGILPDESLAEYRKAKAIYEAVLERAK